MGLIFLAVFLALATTNFTPSLSQQSNQPLEATAQRDCTYNLENEVVETTNPGIDASSGSVNNPVVRSIPVDSNGLPLINEANLIDQYKTVYGNNKRWVLTKRDAPIIAYKVTAGADDSSVLREMDVLGTVNENGEEKWAFISLGHCKILEGSQEGCWDPATLVTLYVLQEKGTDQNNSYPGIDADGNIPLSGTGYAPWIFNVYVSEDLLLSNNNGAGYGNDDLPCWMTRCMGGDLRDAVFDGTPITNPNDFIWNKACPNNPPSPVPTLASPLGQSLSPSEPYPPSFLRRDWVDPGSQYPQPPDKDWGELPEYGFFAGKLTDPGFTSTNSLENYTTFEGRLGAETVTFDVSLKKLGTAAFNDIGYVLKPQTKSTYYLYIPAVTRGSSTEDSLKLSTFTPQPGFVYEWWYPSCKPVVYLYPEKETTYNVALRPFGILTESIPTYPLFGGWQDVTAEPNGKLTYKGENYDYLYYEGRSIYVKVPDNGYTVRQTELNDLFDYLLPELGLQGKEIADFKEYWLSRLYDQNSYYFVSVIPLEEIDRVEPMKIDPEPDTLIRVRLFFKKVDKPALSIHPDLGNQKERVGDTVVDWGGFYKD